MNEKAQSSAEFIIVTFVFIIILITIFTGFLTKIHPEIEKAREQESCLHANSLATILSKEPGQPQGWTAANLNIFGLSNGTEDYISYQNWLLAQSTGYVNIRNKTIPDTSYLVNYEVYAFKQVAAAETCAKGDNTAVVCRFNQTVFQINASVSKQAATLKLKILIPFSYAEIQDYSSLEANDVKTATVSANETLIELELHTSPTDSDKLNITSTEIPKLVFIQKAEYAIDNGDEDLQIFVGNTSVKEDFGSAGTGANGYCESQRTISLVGKNNEVFPARFDALAW